MMISNLIALLIPIIIFFLFFRFNTFKLIREQMDELQESQISRVAFLLEKELNQMDSIVKNIEASLDFSFIRLGDALSVVRAQNELFNIKANNNLINGIAYYSKGTDRFYTDSSPLYEDLFITDFLSVDPDEASIIINERVGIVFSEKGETFYVLKIPVTSSLKRATVFIKLNQSLLNKLLNQLFSDGETGQIRIEDMKTDEYLTIKSPYQRDFKGGYTTLTSYNLDTYSLRLHVETERGLIYSELARSSFFMMIIIILTLMTVIPLIFYLVQRNYIPIQHLRDYLSFHGTGEDGVDTITLAERQLETLFSEKKKYEEQTVETTGFIERELLLGLMRGNIDNPMLYKKRCDDYGIYLTAPQMRVLDVVLEPINEEDDKPILESLLSNLKDKMNGLGVYGFKEFESGRFILLLTGEILDRSVIDILLVDFDSLFFELAWTVAVSGVVSSISQLSHSYLEVKSVQEHRFILGTNQILYGEDLLSREREKLHYPRWLLDNLSSQVKMGDRESMEKTVSSIMSLLREKKPSLFVVRCVSYDMVSTMIKAAIEVTLSDRECMQFADAVELSGIMHLDQMEEVVLQVGCELIDLVMRAGEGHNQNPMAAVTAQIRKNAFDSQITAERVAAEKGMSLSNFSHQFKKYSGTTFSKYLGQLRIERARELLISTELSLSAIVKEIGYSDANSFIKKFKKEMGTTPIEYRRRSIKFIQKEPI